MTALSTTLASLRVARDLEGRLVVSVEVGGMHVQRHDFKTLGGALHWALEVITSKVRATPEDLRGEPS